MPRSQPKHIVIVGAGAAGLMAARELARAGKRVTILEARDRCGGRIQSLSIRDAGRRAEGGAEFVHGEAPVTLGLLREARLSILPIQGTAWTVAEGKFSRRAQDPYTPKFHKALQQLQEDLPIAEFLRRYFAGPEYGGLRRSIERMVESYDAADPERASTLALREEWLNDARSRQARIAGGYGALTDFLVAACREQGGTIRLGAVAKAVETGPGGGASVRCANGDVHAGDVVILTLPVPLLRTIEIPETVRDKVEAAFGGIGFGNVIKILLGFRTRWWTGREPGLGDLTFLLSDRKIPVWWTQFPEQTALLTGWFGGPKTQALAGLDEDQLIEAGLGSLANIFRIPILDLKRNLVAARAINWGADPFAGGAYSYVTPRTREALAGLASADTGSIRFCGEAFYSGAEMGTVEAALTSGLQTARSLLSLRPTSQDRRSQPTRGTSRSEHGKEKQVAIVFITGSTDGLGRAAAQSLLDDGHQVVLHARSADRARTIGELASRAVGIVIGDLSSAREVRGIADQVNSIGRMDAVIHNAGVYTARSRGSTGEGHAGTLAVNTLAPYMLSALIERPDRLVYLSSGLHRGGAGSLDDLDWTKRPWDAGRAYAESKLHVVALAFALARRWPQVLSNAVDPGWARTRMGGPGAPVDIDTGQRTQTWLAVSNEPAAKVSGRYWHHLRQEQPASEATDPKFQDQLIAKLGELTGVALPDA